MNELRDCLLEQVKLHSSMQPQDLVKLCYQSAFGAEHILKDKEAARKYFQQEYQEATEEEKPLYEQISSKVCRVNLSAWKYFGLPSDWLFTIFTDSATYHQSSRKTFEKHLAIAAELIESGAFPFGIREWNTYMEAYRAAGMPAVHHSEQYRQKELPAYRIVANWYIKLFPLLKTLAGLEKEEKLHILAIDGRCAAGKTTLAEALSVILQADVVHMDDFFLPPALRNEKRLMETGGNVHYERFTKEVLPYIAKEKEFSYRIFDCREMNYNGRRSVENKKWRIVEGSYSTHPAFGKYADLTVFLNVSPKEQQKRILKRNGKEMAEIFRTKWIPMEEKYFVDDGILEKADIVINSPLDS